MKSSPFRIRRRDRFPGLPRLLNFETGWNGEEVGPERGPRTNEADDDDEDDPEESTLAGQELFYLRLDLFRG